MISDSRARCVVWLVSICLVYCLIAAAIPLRLTVGRGTSVWAAVREVGLSVLIGVGCALLLQLILKRIQNRKSMLLPAFTMILICSGAATYMESGGLLACMVLGMMLVNTYKHFDSLYSILSDSFESIIFTLFFILSGIHIKWDILGSAWVLAAVYFVARISGKISGTYLAGRISNASPAIRKYTGMALMPQAGVALGLALQAHARADFPESISEILLSVVIATTTVNELVGPIFTRKALILSGEAHSVRADLSNTAKVTENDK